MLLQDGGCNGCDGLLELIVDISGLRKQSNKTHIKRYSCVMFTEYNVIQFILHCIVADIKLRST